jgi:putative transposase
MIGRAAPALWEGRFHSTVVDTDRYLLACQRYIELNPVRAGRWRIPATIAGPAIAPMRVAGPMRCSSRIRHSS